MVEEQDLAQGGTFPPLERIRDVSASIATAVATLAQEHGLAREVLPADIGSYVRSLMYDPAY
jgi:malate dehydrogenase (oxaloacetate-decarboxylating)(NADP+)